MRFSKIFFFFTFFLTIKLLSPCICKVYTTRIIQKADKDVLMKLDEDLKKKKRQNILLISSIVTGIALVLGTAVSLGFYVHKKRKSNSKEGDREKDNNKDNSENEGGDEGSSVHNDDNSDHNDDQ